MSLVYSGNFLMQAEVDTYDVTRILMGIHPMGFQWHLEPGESFQTPEAIITFSEDGLNGMSQTFHKLFRTRLARGYWRDKERPILINNWEATYFDFNEDTIVEIAKSAKKAGIEMFVLDDGWFGTRNDDKQGLGDWFANLNKLEHGISGLSKRIEEECGMKFGLWFEPEMVNENSDLFRKHPDYRIETPGRKCSHGRNEFVLDFSRKEVVDCIYDQMEKLLADSKVSYIKWDMNRSITECFSKGWAANKQGEIFHRYIPVSYTHLARSLIPKSIPIPSLDETATQSSYSMPTVIHQLMPSYFIRGLLYLQFTGIRFFSASLIQFIFCLFFFLEAAKPSIFT